LNNFIILFLDKYKPVINLKTGQINFDKEILRINKYLPIIFNTFTKRINYKHNALKSSEIKVIDKNFPSYTPENYNNLLQYTQELKDRLSGKFFTGMVTPKDIDKVLSTSINEAEFTVDQYSLFDAIVRLGQIGERIRKTFFPDKDDYNKYYDLDEADKNEFQLLYDKYLKVKESDRENQFDNFKKELKDLILRKLEKLKDKHLKVVEDTKSRFTDENIKKYLVLKLYGLEKKQ
jgi:hypothetical protein